MPRIEWTDDDRVDPYPAVLEAIGEAFAFANDESQHIGIIGGSEPAIINAMQRACVQALMLEDTDPASIALVRRPSS